MATVDDAILAVKQDDLLRGLTIFLDIYGTEDAPPISKPKAIGGLSYFGLCLALVRKNFKAAIDLARRAIDLEFYNGDHYANLGRIYVAAGNRKKALETLEKGLELIPGHEYIIEVRKALGVRARPPVPFLDRSNPINVSLGQARHAKKVDEPKRRKR